MLNLRQRTLWRSFLINPIRFVETLISTAVLGLHHHKTAKFNKVQARLYAQREQHYNTEGWVPPATTCQDMYTKVLHR